MYLSGHKSQLNELDVRIQIQRWRIHWDSEGILSSQVSLLLIVYTLSDICCVRSFTLTQLNSSSFDHRHACSCSRCACRSRLSLSLSLSLVMKMPPKFRESWQEAWKWPLPLRILRLFESKRFGFLPNGSQMARILLWGEVAFKSSREEELID